MSLRQVRKPHMKNNVVTTAKGTVYDVDPSETDAEVELPGETIAMNCRLESGISVLSPTDHSIAGDPPVNAAKDSNFS